MAAYNTCMLTAERIIEFFRMQPLSDEGGFYVETWRAAEEVAASALPARYGGARNFGTAILYLITAENCSRLHKVASDEIFHFYLGDPVCMVQLLQDGKSETVTLGPDILAGQRPQVVVAAGTWQGCWVVEPGRFALLGCTVAPGFDFADYQSAEGDQLMSLYPDQGEIIRRLT